MNIPGVAAPVEFGTPEVTPAGIGPDSVVVDALLGQPAIVADQLPVDSAEAQATPGAPEIHETGLVLASIQVDVESNAPVLAPEGLVFLDPNSVAAQATPGPPRLAQGSLLPDGIEVTASPGDPTVAHIAIGAGPSAAATPGEPAITAASSFGTSITAKAVLGEPGILDAANVYTLHIAGVDRTAYLRVDSLEVSPAIAGRGSMRFRLRDTTNSYRPSLGDEVFFHFGQERVFGGVLEDYEETAPSGGNTTIFLECTARDFGSVLERIVVFGYWDGIHTPSGAGFISSSVRVRFLEDLGFWSISSGLGSVLRTFIAQPMPATELYNKVASASGVDWYVDQWKTIRFLAPDDPVAAPYSLTQGDNLKRVVANSMAVRHLGNFYRNTTYVNMSAATGGRFSESCRHAHPGAYTWYASFPIVEAPDVTFTGPPTGGGADIERTATVIQGPTVPASGWDVMWSKGATFLTVNPNGVITDFDFVNTVDLQATYVAMDGSPSFRVYRDADEIAARGRWETVENSTDVETADEAEDLAEALTDHYSAAGFPLEANFETDLYGTEIENLLRPGQTITMDFTRPLISGNFLITAVSMREHQGSLKAATPFLRSRVTVATAGLRRSEQQVRQNRSKAVDPITFLLQMNPQGASTPGLETGLLQGREHIVTQSGAIADAHVFFATRPEGEDSKIQLTVQTQAPGSFYVAEEWQDLVTIDYPAYRIDAQGAISNGIVKPIGVRLERGTKIRVRVDEVGSEVAGANGTLRLRLVY